MFHAVEDEPNIEGYVDGYAETAPVGSFKPNRYDLYDLGGNVLVIQTPSRVHDRPPRKYP